MNNEYDLIVAGGGLAGVAASVSAAREGLRVLLIEQAGYLGGAACNNLVSPFCAYWRIVNGEKDFLNCGIFSQILDLLHDAGGINDDRVIFHEEYLKLILERLILKHNVTPLYHTAVIGADCSNGEITSISTFNKSGTVRYKASYFIDATGDADLTALAGFGFSVGDTHGNCQPMTLCFRLGNVDFKDMTHFEVRKTVNGLYNQFQRENKIKNPRENVLIFSSMQPKTLHFNSTRIVKKNPLNAFDLTEAEIEAREQMFELFNFLKSNFQMFKDSYLDVSAPSIGVRESRRITGEYEINIDDILECKKFDDSIARGNYPVDIHNPLGSGTVLKKVKEGDFYTIPYKSLVPKGSVNLCVAGRCISATHEAQSSLRVMPIACCTGEGAGTAVAVAFNHNTSLSNVDINKVQKILKKNNALY